MDCSKNDTKEDKNASEIFAVRFQFCVLQLEIILLKDESIQLISKDTAVPGDCN